MDSVYIGTIVAWPINFVPEGWMYCEGQILQVSQFQALYSLLGNTYGGSYGTTFALPDLRARTIVGCNYSASNLPHYNFGVQMGSSQVDPVLLAHNHVLPTSGMSVDLSRGSVNVSASEMTINSSGTYGLPLTSETASGASMPTTSDYYQGTTKLSNGSALNAFYKSGTTPTVTTQPTPISVTGKGTPNVSGSISGNVPVTVPPNTVVSPTGVPGGKMSVMQPGLALRYIICIDGIYPSRA